MSERWLTIQETNELLALASDMAERITALVDDCDDSGSDASAERDILRRFDVFYATIVSGGTYPATSTADAGYWVFTRHQLDRLTAGLDQQAAATVLQALDSPAARQLGLHILPKEHAA